jgi:hypothetical protein
MKKSNVEQKDVGKKKVAKGKATKSSRKSPKAQKEA